ncbi:G2/mitotic-specific cyclin-B-like isoform X2 [Dysidea avara]|uniref:G2/mitotic-specific cyclin-B-like isoform X2 n=1 Tax=Dysidea avara TaxID=196820 RepID=UPI003322D905
MATLRARNLQMEGETKKVFKKPTAHPRPALGNIINKVREPQAVEKNHLKIAEPPAVTHDVPDPITASPEAMDMAEAFSELNIDDIDNNDFDNPQLCAEYVKEIYKYIREQELNYQVDPNYMKRQPEINEKMRAILIDWLIQVHIRFGLLAETLYLTVSIIDRYLSVHAVKKCDLQLVGVTAMLIASKYEEMYAPEVRDFVYITDNTYSSERIRKMEVEMLKELNYMFGNPLCLHFLRRNSKAGEVTPEIHTMAKFLMELCLVDYSMLKYPPSMIAASALYLSIKLYEITTWTPNLKHYSTYNDTELTSCIERMAVLVSKMEASKHKAVKDKYSSSKFLRISKEASLRGDIIKKLARAEN